MGSCKVWVPAVRAFSLQRMCLNTGPVNETRKRTKNAGPDFHVLFLKNLLSLTRKKVGNSSFTWGNPGPDPCPPKILAQLFRCILQSEPGPDFPPNSPNTSLRGKVTLGVKFVFVHFITSGLRFAKGTNTSELVSVVCPYLLQAHVFLSQWM
jgi:hypothetical protein